MFITVQLETACRTQFYYYAQIESCVDLETLRKKHNNTEKLIDKIQQQKNQGKYLYNYTTTV